MIQRAQEVVKLVHDRVRTTLNVVADFAESMGVPPSVTSMLQRGNGEVAATPYTPPPAPVAPVARTTTQAAPAAETAAKAPKKKSGKKRGLVSENEDLSSRVRVLDTEDAINGSTYLARIIWCLGVADLEGGGALKPAQIARMVMARTAVSLEPPNVARYIRRSKPTSITVDRSEGNSNFYKLNAKGKKLFEEKFGLN